MPIQQSLARAVALAAWKTNQQVRLFEIQNRVRGLENQIRTQKARLADIALTLHTQGRLSEEELKEIGNTIVQLHKQVQEQQRWEEAIRNEQPPEQAYSPTLPPTLNIGQPGTDGLVCPQCGKPVPARFCIEHGAEGVPKS